LLAAGLSAWCACALAQPSGETPPAPPAQPVAAQPATSPPAAAAPAVAAPATEHLAADTLVHIELVDQVSSKTGKRGDKFAIRLSSAIVVDGHVVAPAGATGEGEVVYAEPGGGGGAPGKLVLAARYITVGDQRIPLKAFHLGAGGDSEFTQMQVAAQFIGPAVMFINGHEVVYPVGTRANAKVAQDLDLPAGPAAPAPAAASPSPQEPPK
jgi:hypothetical protein